MVAALRTGIFTTLALASIVGCDPAEPKAEPYSRPEVPVAGGLGPPSPKGMVEPSSTPSLPSTSKAQRELDDKKMDPPK